MSNITDIYSKIRTAIPTLTGFDTKSEIPYPYDLEKNNVNFIREGWGIKVGPSSPQTDPSFPEFTVTTEYEIILTKRVATTLSNSAPLIAATIEIMDDISTLQDDFTATPPTTSTRFSQADKITKVDVISISAIENVVSGKFNHITTSITFGITHWK